MSDRHMQQFRLPRMSRNHQAMALEMLKRTREAAPVFCDWLRDRVADDLLYRLESGPGGIHEREFLELPFSWTNRDLSAALGWCDSGIYLLKDYQLGKLADVLHRAVIVAVMARLNYLEATR